MIKFRTRNVKIAGKLKLRRVFWKAVRGYKRLRKSGLVNLKEFKGKAYPYPVSFGGGGGGGGLEIKGAAVKISEIKAEKFVIGGEEEEEEGIPIVASETEFAGIKEPESNVRNTNILYDLIRSGSKVFASVNIRWSDADSSLLYQVIEPKLTAEEKSLLNQIKTVFVET